MAELDRSFWPRRQRIVQEMVAEVRELVAGSAERISASLQVLQSTANLLEDPLWPRLAGSPPAAAEEAHEPRDRQAGVEMRATSSTTR